MKLISNAATESLVKLFERFDPNDVRWSTFLKENIVACELRGRRSCAIRKEAMPSPYMLMLTHVVCVSEDKYDNERTKENLHNFINESFRSVREDYRKYWKEDGDWFTYNA